jgi:hypothetical protein
MRKMKRILAPAESAAPAAASADDERRRLHPAAASADERLHRRRRTSETGSRRPSVVGRGPQSSGSQQVPSVVEDHIATLADRCRHQRHPGEHQPSGAAALRKLSYESLAREGRYAELRGPDQREKVFLGEPLRSRPPAGCSRRRLSSTDAAGAADSAGAVDVQS